MRTHVISLGAAALLLSFCLAIWPAPCEAEEGRPTDARAAIAILPFARASTELTEDATAAALAQALSAALARVHGQQVVDQGRLRRALDAAGVAPGAVPDVVAAQRVASLTEARWLIAGTFQRAQGAARVTWWQVDGPSGTQVKESIRTLSRKMGPDADILLLQDDLLAGLLKALDAKPDEGEKALIGQVTHATENPKAWESLMRGRVRFLGYSGRGMREAIPLLEKAAALDPRCGLAWAWLAEALVWQASWDAGVGLDAAPRARRALELANKAVALTPGLSDAYRAATAVYRLPEWAPLSPPITFPETAGGAPIALDVAARRAEWNARKAIELNPRDAEAHLFLWRILYRPLQGEGAQEVETALRLDPGLGVAWRAMGGALAEQGEFEKALEAYRKAAAANSDDVWAWYRVGWRLRSQGKMDDALDAFRRAQTADPAISGAGGQIGRVLTLLGRREEAMAAYHKAIELNPRDSGAYTGLGGMLYEGKKWTEAAAAYRRAIEIAPDDAGGWWGLGYSLRNLEELAESNDALRRTVEIEPTNHEFWVAYANGLFTQRRWSEAAQAFRKAAELDKEDTSSAAQAGWALLNDGKHEEAAEALLKATVAHPRSALAHTGLGLAYRYLKRFDDSIAACRKAIEVDPKFALAHGALGMALKEKDDKPGAIASLKRFMELAPTDPMAQGWLPQVRELLRGLGEPG